MFCKVFQKCGSKCNPSLTDEVQVFSCLRSFLRLRSVARRGWNGRVVQWNLCGGVKCAGGANVAVVGGGFVGSAIVVSCIVGVWLAHQAVNSVCRVGAIGCFWNAAWFWMRKSASLVGAVREE